MRSAFIACVLFVCGTVYGGEAVSVMAEPTPAQPAIVAAEPISAVAAPCCSNGTCSATVTRFRSVTRGCDACTGKPVRNVTRGVVTTAGEVVSTVGAAAVNVATFPVRAVRGCRSCRSARCGSCCCR